MLDRDSKSTSPDDAKILEPDAPISTAKMGFWDALRLYFTSGGAALKHRNYRLFWTGQLISLVGTWMQNLAQGWLVLKLTNNDPFALGTVTALQFLPIMLFSIFTGVVADRYPKRRVLLITQASAMALALTLAVLATTQWIQVWQIYVLATGLGLVNVFDVPARQSFVSEMVGKEDLMNAVALNSSIFNAARFVGPALAGLIIGLGEALMGSTLAGVAFAFWLNGLSYIAVLSGLARMHPEELHSVPPRAQSGSIIKNLKEGFQFIRQSPDVRAVIFLVGMVGTFGVNFNVWIPVLARTYLHVGAEGYGILMGAIGLGSLAAALTLAVQGRRPSRQRLLMLVAFFGLCEIIIGYSPWYIVSLVFMFAAGLCSIMVFNTANTTVQLTTPDNLRGRVMGVYILVFAGTTPIGSLFMGWLASWGGTPFSMAMGGILSACAVPLYWFTAWRGRRNSEISA